MGPAEEIFEKIKDAGEVAITEFIEVRKSEELYLDFKRSADGGKGPRVLHETDRNNFAAAISGFGNSEGGVIVWGVDASKDSENADVAKAKFPIDNVARFVSWLNGTVSSRTVPPHSGVRNYAIDIGQNRGFVISLIPKSERAPHQAIPELKYYMRAGSSFVPVPHGILAGMFGRRPQPTLTEQCALTSFRVNSVTGGRIRELDLSIEFRIYNHGPVTARELYSDIRAVAPEVSRIHFSNINEEWSAHKKSLEWLSMTSKNDFKLAPESYAALATLRILLRPPFTTGGLRFKWTFGAEGCPTDLVEINHSSVQIANIYDTFLSGPMGESERHQLVGDIIQNANLEIVNSVAEVTNPKIEPRRRPIRFRVSKP